MDSALVVWVVNSAFWIDIVWVVGWLGWVLGRWLVEFWASGVCGCSWLSFILYFVEDF